ncbi:MAG: HAMP domain-containing protein, partial [Anaerolineae bacterium]|nr:HAMP domain-containing protein [Anaerolineae bacterium]
MMRSLSLTPKVTLTFVVFAAVLLTSVGLLSYTSGRDALEEATFSDLLSAAVQKEAAFETWINEGQTQIASIAQSPFLQDTVTTLRTASDPVIAQNAHDQIVAEFAPVVEGNRFVNLAVLEPVSGKVIASTDPTQEGTYKEDRLYFINGQEGPYIQNVYFSLECQCPSMAASAPLRSPEGELLAVVVGKLNLDKMGAIINLSTGLHDSTDAYLVNTASFLVTQPGLLSDPAVLQRGIRTQAAQQCLEGSSGSIVGEDYRGVQTMAVYRWLPTRDLCLVVKVDQSEALQPVQSFGRSLFWVSMLALGVASIVAVGMANTITRPIRALKDGVTRFGQGDFNVRLSSTAKDELGALVREFNAMADSIVEKDRLLQNYAKNLEQRVNERTTQLTFLAEASRRLSESFDYEERLKQVAQLTVPQIADWCSIDILDDEGLLQRLAVVHTDPKKVEYAYELQRRYPSDPSAPSGAYNILRTGQSEFYPEITDEMLIAAAPDEE